MHVYIVGLQKSSQYLLRDSEVSLRPIIFIYLLTLFLWLIWLSYIEHITTSNKSNVIFTVLNIIIVDNIADRATNMNNKKFEKY